MSIRSSLEKAGLQPMQGQAQLFYSIGTAAMTLSALILLSWVSVTFGKAFHFSFAWIFTILMAVSYYFRFNIKLTISTTVVMVVLTLVGLLFGYPSPSAFSLILFIVLLVGGWLLQAMACKKSASAGDTKSQMTQLYFAPLLYTYFILERLRLTEKVESMSAGRSDDSSTPSDEDGQH